MISQVWRGLAARRDTDFRTALLALESVAENRHSNNDSKTYGSSSRSSGVANLVSKEGDHAAWSTMITPLQVNSWSPMITMITPLQVNSWSPMITHDHPIASKIPQLLATGMITMITMITHDHPWAFFLNFGSLLLYSAFVYNDYKLHIT